jgi:hypothetical protein
MTYDVPKPGEMIFRTRTTGKKRFESYVREMTSQRTASPSSTLLRT